MTLAGGAVALAIFAHAAAGIPPLLPEGPPQLADPVKVFFDADAHAGDLERGVLVCRVDIVGNQGWDTFGAVDLLVTFTLGGRAPVEVWGPEDRSSAVVTLPAADLKVGEKLRVHVEDRDLTEREHISRGQVVFAGTLPLRMDLEDTQVECRGMSRAVAEARARPAITRAAAAHMVLEAAQPDLLVDGLGLPFASVMDADHAAAETEAWLGSDDVAVRDQRDRTRLAVEKQRRAAREQMVAARAALPVTGTGFPLASLGVSARVVPGPLLSLEITANGDVTFEDEDVADRVIFLLERGRELEVSGRAVVRDATGEPRKLTKGQVHVVHVKPVSGAALPEIARIDGVLVRVR